jgi:hypothetical protein
VLLIGVMVVAVAKIQFSPAVHPHGDAVEKVRITQKKMQCGGRYEPVSPPKYPQVLSGASKTVLKVT